MVVFVSIAVLFALPILLCNCGVKCGCDHYLQRTDMRAAQLALLAAYHPISTPVTAACFAEAGSELCACCSGQGERPLLEL
jgi:hypothetical protein